MRTTRLGRRPALDVRDQGYLISKLLAAPKPTKPTKPARIAQYWRDDVWWGDQGKTPECVGFAWVAWLHDGPILQRGPAPVVNPTRVYRVAQQLDEWPGTNYAGTSVRGGVKAVKKLGFIKSYHWAWDATNTISALLNLGPVVLGTPWFRDMDRPNAAGVILPRGPIVGGHAAVLNGVNRKQKLVRLKNSWGRSWGKAGYAFLSFASLATLFAHGAEACLASEIRR
jgi:hypothetical protein